MLTCRSKKMNQVCSSCFSDKDLQTWIRQGNGPRGCSACGQFDSPTVKFEVLLERIEECISRYYGKAVDHLYYCSADGGYIGPHWNTWELFGMIGLELPRDMRGSLQNAIISSMVDEVWCEFDPGGLDIDDALWGSWDRFCETIKHERRFFFHSTGEDGRDSLTPASLLDHIARTSEDIGLLKEIPAHTALWRARPDLTRGRRWSAANYGPPPIEFARQSNRMNPAGIPMLYLASTTSTALFETRTHEARVGQWRVLQPLRVLDLRTLPPEPGMFSDATRTLKQTLSFLRSFAADIMMPVERDERVHIDYLPSQVVTEFVRDYKFDGGAVDGIAYRSTVRPGGWNVALFLSPVELGLEPPPWGKIPPQRLSFEGDKWSTLPT